MAALLAMDGWTLLALDLGAEHQRTETKNGDGHDVEWRDVEVVQWRRARQHGELRSGDGVTTSHGCVDVDWAANIDFDQPHRVLSSCAPQVCVPLLLDQPCDVLTSRPPRTVPGERNKERNDTGLEQRRNWYPGSAPRRCSMIAT